MNAIRNRSVCPHTHHEAIFMLTPSGLSTLWELSRDSRLDIQERASLTKTLSELESAREVPRPSHG